MLNGGDQIGTYEIERELGRGGMGVVYRAQDTRLGRAVAIKGLPEDVVGSEERLARFEREARALAALNHPNVGAIYGLETDGDRRYLVLELVEGESLEARLEQGALSVDEALDVCGQIASGLEAAHDAGLVHRDLKPANVMICADGRVKVLDFGLAKSNEGVASSTSEAPTLASGRGGTSPTIPGAIMGTAAYMSPEQARGRSVDRRTDVWALGVILYECLTGVGPFAGETATDSIGAVLHKEVEMERLPAGVPAGVRRLLERCLARGKADRWRDMGDVRVELERARLAGPEASAPGGSGAGRGLGLLGVIGWVIALAAIVVGGLLYGGRRGDGVRVVRSSVMAPEGIGVNWAEISPDGSRIAVMGRVIGAKTEDASHVRSVYLRDLSWAEMRRVEGSEGVQQIRFSPDGRTLAILTVGGEASSDRRLLSVASDLSSPVVEVTAVPDSLRVNGSSWFSWTADGEIACVSRGSGELVVFDMGTGRESRRVAIDTGGEEIDYASLVGPFGKDHIAVHTLNFTESGYREDSGLISVRTGLYTNVVEDANALRLTPGGDVVFSRGESIFRSAFDFATLTTIGAHRPMLSGLATDTSWDNGWFSLSNEGALAYQPGGLQGASRSIVFVDEEAQETPWSDERRAFEQNVTVSADGRRMAVLVANRGGLYELWVSEIDRPRLRRLLSEPGADFYDPVFTPDGEQIVVTRWSQGVDEGGTALVVRFDGTEAPRRLYGGWTRADFVEAQSVSADGERVLMRERFHGRGVRLVEVSLDDGEDRNELMATMSDVHSPSYAPADVPLIAYVSDEAGRPEAYVRAITPTGLGPAIPVSTRGAWLCAWSVGEAGAMRLHHTGLDRREFVTEITYDQRPVVGETTLAVRAVGAYSDAHLMRDGRLMAIKYGDDEAPVTRLELVQGWLGSVGDGE